MRIKVGKIGYYVSASICLIVCTSISGYTGNRVSLLTRQPTGAPIKASEVKLFPRFNDIKEPYQVEGMISAYTLPIMSNTVEKRIKLIKETAAELGINAVVVLQDDIKLGPSGPLNEHVGPGRSIAILANIGSAPQQNSKDSPKFIVCLPNINFGIIEKDRVLELLENYLREHIIYSLGYQKGYYVYKCDAPGVDSAGILNGSASPNALIEPIGITPDFLLLCNVEVYDADYGKNGKTVFNAFGISMTLYDLMERKAIWTGKTEKILGRSVLVTPLEGLGSPFLVPEVLGDAIMKAIDTIPSVEGFRMGPASKY